MKPAVPFLAPILAMLVIQSANCGVIHQDFNSILHGQIIDNEFSTPSFGFTVSGNNYHDSRDWVVGFDTNRRWTRDSDLEDPFDMGNVRDLDFQEALILQEAGVGRDYDHDGFLDTRNDADDEGRRPAGWVKFDFNEDISVFGLDLLDVEGSLERFKLQFFKDGVRLASVGFDEFVNNTTGIFYDDTIEFGNNSANRIAPISADMLSAFTGTTIENFDAVKVKLGGSGAIDNLKYGTPDQLPAVPEPSTFLVWVSGLGVAMIGQSRRRREIG